MDAWATVSVLLSVGARSAGIRRVLLWGPPGTGKTRAAQREGWELQGEERLSCYSVTLTEDTPAAELRGHYVPRGGDFIWMDGPGIRAWREGARLVLNEIDHASPDSMTLLHALTDDDSVAALTLPTGETVRPRDGYHVVATCNGDPDGLPEALGDRFPVRVRLEEPHPGAIEALSEPLRKVARATAGLTDGRRIGLRSWTALDSLSRVLPWNDALRVVLGPQRAQEYMDALRVAGAPEGKVRNPAK